MLYNVLYTYIYVILYASVMTQTNYQINEISTQTKGVDVSVYYNVIALRTFLP